MSSVPFTVIVPGEGDGGGLLGGGEGGGLLGGGVGGAGVVTGGDDGGASVEGVDDGGVLVDGAAGELSPPHAVARSTTAMYGIRVWFRKCRVKTRTVLKRFATC